MEVRGCGPGLREVEGSSLGHWPGGSRLSCSRGAIWPMEPAVSTVPLAGQGPHRGWGAPPCPATVGSTAGARRAIVLCARRRTGR